MAKSSRPTAQKRAREKAQMDRAKEKQQRRAETRDRKATAEPRSPDEDPDIAGIRPGPQPRPEWLLELEAEERKAAELLEEAKDQAK